MSLTNTTNRRSAERMPIEQDVHYRSLSRRSADVAGTGKTVNITSSSVLKKNDLMLLPGSRLELDINWPAQLDNKCALKLVARGRVVRFQDGVAAMEIVQHEFRTKGRAASR